MIVECSSCGKTIGETAPYGGPNDKWTNQIIHEVCNQCKQDFVKEDGNESCQRKHEGPNPNRRP